MPAHDINHINIKAPQPLLDQVKTFYVQVVGLQEGERPAVPVPGYWLYLGGRPVVHLMTPRANEEVASGSVGHLDHVAFTCTDLAGMIAHLDQLGLAYRRRDVPDLGVTQLFLTDPTGLGVELNFAH